MDVEAEELLRFETIVRDLIVRKSQGGNPAEIAKALFGFITSAEPNFFVEYEAPLKHHLEKLVAEYEAKPHRLAMVANQIAGLIVIGRQGNKDALAEKDW